MLATLTLGFKFLMEDGTYIKKNVPVSYQASKWSVLFTCVTLNQLLQMDPALTAQLVVSYAVSLDGDGIPLVGPYNYEVDYRTFYKSYTLLYRSSLGSVETIVLRGQVDFQSDYSRDQVRRTVPPSYYENMNLLPQTMEGNTAETTSYKGNTGFMSQSALEKLRDLFLSDQKYEVVNGKLIPIVLSSNSSKWYTNTDNKYAAEIEWSRAFTNDHYTPEGFIPVNNTCPAVDVFSVKQINNQTLQIMYSLPTPYEKVKVSIDDGYGIASFTFEGNVQSFYQPYDLSQISVITCTAQVICDEDSNPMSVGPLRTLPPITINNNLPPVANDDTFTISSGYNSLVTLPGSVLTNDYDPDGGAISAVAASGSTNAGGSYNINGAGVVQYRPPSSSYKGQDYFDYSIDDGNGGSASGRVYINVGDSTKVYVRLVIESKTTTTNNGLGQPFDQTKTTTGKVYLQFFRDAAATTPIDVTGMGITANLSLKNSTKTFFHSKQDATSSVSTPCGSYTTLVYDGELYYYHAHDFGGSTGIDYELRQKEYTLLPGNGYVVL